MLSPNPWRLRDPDPALVRSIERASGVPATVARLLAIRGHSDGSRFLEPSLASLHPPDLLPDLQAACARLGRAIREDQTILVHGDYDVDGVTGTAILVRLLRHLGARVEWTIPNRLEDGYSFGKHSIRTAQRAEASVVVSVDNGTSAGDVIAELAALGIDTVVTDHHEPPRGAPLPDATAIVNPKLEGSRYPFRELCGAGVAFKLAWGLCQEISGARRVRADLKRFLTAATALVATATVCDVVPLVDENRTLARFGLGALAAGPVPGLRALLRVCGLSDRRITAEDVGFQIGPRLNAAGRLGRADRAVELLLAEDEERAHSLAADLDQLNARRRAIERELLDQALAAAQPFADVERWPVLVLAGQGWHQGVVGIVAARLCERFGRPALVIGLEGDEGRGSARSVPGFDVLEAMHGGAAHMQRYGGHAAAAGCEVRAQDVDLLREAVCQRARELLGGQGFEPAPLWIDAELPLAAMGPELMRQIERLEPWGEANAVPVFSSRAHLAEPPRLLGEEQSHLQLRLRDGERTLRAMAFGLGARAGELALGRPIEVAYTPRWNTFRGETRLELLVRDFRSAERR